MKRGVSLANGPMQSKKLNCKKARLPVARISTCSGVKLSSGGSSHVLPSAKASR